MVGTKEEMQRLLKDAEKFSGVKYDISNLNDVFQAIHVIQQELDITGTTAKEAEETISGSISSMKSAWDNFLNGSGTFNQFIETAKIAFNNVATAVSQLLPRIAEEIGKTIINIVPKRIVEAIKNINFNPLKESFENLYSSIESLVKIISSNLKNVLENVIYPIAKFTIGKVIPTFFDLLAGAIEFATPIISTFKSIGKWLLDNFLTPLVKWSANKVITGMKGVADALGKIGKWMSSHKSIIKGVVTVLSAFFVLWKATEFIAFIQMSGGVTSALTKITTAINASTTAKIKDLAEMVALKVMYAKDFVVSLAKTASQLAKNTAIWITNTVAMASANGTTVAGTIAILAHEVAVKAVTTAQKLWNTIMSACPIGAVVVAVTALIAGIVALTNHLKKGTKEQQAQTEEMKKQADAAEEVKNKYKEMQQQQQEVINAELSELSHTQSLADELKRLADENGNVQEKDKARAEFILGELNNALGTEYTMIDNQIQKYDELKNTIDEQIEQKRMQALLEAREVEYRESLANWTDLQAKKDQANLEYEKILEEEKAKGHKANMDRVNEAERQYKAYDEAIELCAKNIVSYEDGMTASLEGNYEKAKYILQNKQQEYKTLTDLADKSAEEQKAILKEQYEKSLEYAYDYWEKYEQGVAGYTEDSMNEAFEFAENCKEEAKRAGVNINEGLEEGIDESSDKPQNATRKTADNLLKEFKDRLGIKSPSKLFKQYGEYINDGLANGLNSNSNKPQSALGKIASNLVSSFKNKLKINSPSKLFKEFGKFTVDGYIDGIEENSSKLSKVSKEIANEVEENLNLKNFKTNIELEKTSKESLLKFKNAILSEKASSISQAGFQANRNNTKTINNDNGININNTQNFYSKNSTPHEEQKQAKQQLRRLAYGL